MSKIVMCAYAVGVLLAAASPASAEDSPELKKWNACAAQVRKDYPVPPGNVNTQQQLIEQECGKKPPK